MIHRGFQKRYLFTAELLLETGLHIGGGEISFSASDDPVVRTPDGQPYIPGSSLKGAFRSTVEKLAATVGLCSCWLMEGEGCPGAQGEEQRSFNRKRQEEGWSDAVLLRHLTDGVEINGHTLRLCDTCWLFGSPYAASKISFSDLYLAADMEGIVQVRDGVAIDRDSEKQVPGLLYNYEVVAPTVTFGMEILLENPTDTDLQLTCLGLSEFQSGFGGLGGKRSRGLGRCTLAQMQIYELDLSIGDTNQRAERLRRYLLGTTPAEKMTLITDGTAFIDGQIENLLT